MDNMGQRKTLASTIYVALVINGFHDLTILEMLAWTPICPKDKRLSTLDNRVSTVDIRLSKLRVNI